MTKKIISIFALAFAIALPSQISTHAATSPSFNERIVTAKNGLNIRDKNCKRIDTLPYGTNLGKVSDSIIYCTIAGQKVKMVNYITIGYNDNNYVADQFTAPVSGKYFDFSKVQIDKQSTYPILKVDSTGGLNLRDDSCKKITTLTNGTQLNPLVATDNFPVCKVGNTYFSMISINYQGNVRYVASTYLTQVK